MSRIFLGAFNASALCQPPPSSTMTSLLSGCRAATSSRNICIQTLLRWGRIKVSSSPSATETAAYTYTYSWLTMPVITGRIGRGHQHRRMSEMRPNLASSWKITRRGSSPGHWWSISASSSGNFFSTLPVCQGQSGDAFYLEQASAKYGDAEDCTRRQEQLLCPSEHQVLV